MVFFHSSNQLNKLKLQQLIIELFCCLLFSYTRDHIILCISFIWWLIFVYFIGLAQEETDMMDNNSDIVQQQQFSWSSSSRKRDDSITDNCWCCCFWSTANKYGRRLFVTVCVRMQRGELLRKLSFTVGKESTGGILCMKL